MGLARGNGRGGRRAKGRVPRRPPGDRPARASAHRLRGSSNGLGRTDGGGHEASPGRARLTDGLARLARLAPGLAQARSYQRAWLRGDMIGGITVAAYLVPQVMAYAGLAGLPPVTGLWAIIPALALVRAVRVVAAVVGRPGIDHRPHGRRPWSRPLAAGNPGRYAELAAALAVIVGALAFAAWVMRLGFVADLLSQPTLVGYMTGVALIMMVGQLQKVTGVPVHGDTFFAEIRSFVSGVGELDAATAGAGRGHAGVPARAAVALPADTRAAARGAARHRSPSACSTWTRTASPSSARYRPGCRPRASRPRDDLQDMVLPAVGVLLVGYTDVVLTARAFATRSGHTIDANQELLAVGAANIGAGLFRGFPVSSSASRTAIGDASGARTQLHSLVALASVVAVLLFLGPLLAHFPTASLGAIVIYAAIRLIDIPGFRRLAAFRRSELLLAAGRLRGRAALRHPLRNPARDRPVGRRPAGPGGPPARRGPRAHPRVWPGCTTSTTTRRPSWCRAWSSTATTRPCSSPTRRTSGTAPWPPSTPARRRSRGSSSTLRRTWTWTSPRSTPWRRCARRWPARHRVRPGPGQTGAPAATTRRRVLRPDRTRPHLPDAADGSGRLRGVATGAAVGQR